MVDLIALAYGFNATNILDGPNWLEMDRFDVIAKEPPQTAPDNQKLMLKTLLAERFNLVIKEETKAMPSYSLTVGKKPQLKEADGSGEPGCIPQSSAPGPPGEGVLRVMLPGSNGNPIQVNLANGMIDFKCRNMTMKAFADGLRGMIGANLGVNPVLDQTGLSGTWNFDLRNSLLLSGPNGPFGERLTISDAIEKQLGLKLEAKPIPVPVLTVQSVDQKPNDNPPGTAEAFPANPPPTEFEVATVKPTSPELRSSRFQMQPGGRLTVEGMALNFLISRAFNTNNYDLIVGMPSWAGTARFDLVAKVPSDGTPVAGPIDQDVLAPMMLSLLKDRFKLTYHTEQRDMPAYTLTSAKPKMTKTDPSARSWCKFPAQVPGAAPAPSGSTALICQNVTMAQFVDQLRARGELFRGAPVLDSTGIEGGWDFRLTFNPILTLNVTFALPVAPRTPGGGQPGNQAGAASDPVSGYTVFEAMEKQLGLKLVQQKRPATVYVVDHIDQTPSEN